MKYKVTHNTTFSYSETVPVCQNLVHLTPREGRRQTCRYHRLVIKPVPSYSSRRADYFGNPVQYFSIHEGHHRLSVTAVSKVSVTPAAWPRPDETPPWEDVVTKLAAQRTAHALETLQFTFDSPRVATSYELLEYARASFPPGRPVLAAAIDLTARIHADFTYDPSATVVTTPLDEVFRLKRGVCQDLAQLEIGCLRSLGLAARYVSGYLLTQPPPGRPRLLGVDASHAWLAVYGGAAGWIDIDPTNNLLPSTEHITLSWGRDYSDVCPIEGVFVGGGQHAMDVAVSVVPVESRN